MGDDGAALTSGEWLWLVIGFSLGLVIGLCLGIISVILGDPKE